MNLNGSLSKPPLLLLSTENTKTKGLMRKKMQDCSTEPVTGALIFARLFCVIDFTWYKLFLTPEKKQWRTQPFPGFSVHFYLAFYSSWFIIFCNYAEVEILLFVCTVSEVCHANSQMPCSTGLRKCPLPLPRQPRETHKLAWSLKNIHVGSHNVCKQ